MSQDRATSGRAAISPAVHARSATGGAAVPSRVELLLAARPLRDGARPRRQRIWNFQTNFSQSVAVANAGSPRPRARTDVGITSRSRSPASAFEREVERARVDVRKCRRRDGFQDGAAQPDMSRRPDLELL